MPCCGPLRNDLNWERFKATLHEEISSLRGEMTSLRGDLRSEMKGVQADLMKWMFIYWSGTMLSVAALVMVITRR